MTVTSIDTAREAIYQRWVDNWTLTSYVFENENSDSLDKGSADWARVSVREQLSRQETLGQPGDRRYQRRGAAFIQFFTGINAGAAQAGVLAEAARNIFEGEDFEGLDFFDVQVRDLGPNQEKKWQLTVVEAAFTYEITK